MSTACASETGAAAGSDGRRVLVLGGSSEIALAIVRELQSRGPREVALGGRDAAALGAAAADLGTCGCARVLTFALDALDLARHERVLAQAFGELGGADIVILAVGVLGERGGLPADIAAATSVLEVNLVGAGSLLMRTAARLRDGARGNDRRAVLGRGRASPARERRLRSIQGRPRLARAGARRRPSRGRRARAGGAPGVRQDEDDARPAGGAPPTTPRAVAVVTVDGLERGAHTVWAPRRLRWAMLMIKLIPRLLFRRIEQ